MKYRESDTQATDNLRLTLKRLVEHKLPPNPVNYTVWYEHVANINPKLSKVIDENLKTSVIISRELIQNLYVELIMERGKQAADKLKNEIQQIISSDPQDSEYMLLTLKHLNEHKLSPTPTNYTVWYEHVANLNPALSKALNDKLKNSPLISKDLVENFYTEMIMNRGKEAVDKLRNELMQVVGDVFSDVSSAGSDYSKFGTSLVEFTRQLQQAENKDAFQQSLKKLMMQVKEVGTKNKTFSERLQSTTSELKSLQDKLKEAEQFASTDGLTGLWNRRSLEEKLSAQILQSQNGNGSLCVIMSDIDHFKRVNDTHGHLVGDDLLRIVAKTMRDQVKRKDIVCRYGGEEFVIVLPQTTIEGATTVAENIRKHFANMTWKQKSSGSSLGKITLSFGVATYMPGESHESLLGRADSALYQSKENGRNRVTVAAV